MGDLDGEVPIVTGAGRGIGRTIAFAYAREDARVVVASRTPATVTAVADEIVATGGIALAIPCVVGHAGDLAARVAGAVEAFGTVDILVMKAVFPHMKRQPPGRPRTRRRRARGVPGRAGMGKHDWRHLHARRRDAHRGCVKTC